MKSKVILFNTRPEGMPTSGTFRTEEYVVQEAADGELLLKALYISVDPYLRGRMRKEKSYAKGFETGKPIQSAVIAEVIESGSMEFAKGDIVSGILDWSEYQISNGEGLTKVDPDIAPLPVFLGLLGMPGLTAYLGLFEIGRPQPGETLVVSGAAGAVGSVVGQIGKISGCRVVGIAGGDEKVSMLKNELGFDDAINYKTTKDIHKAISEVCPDGVDIYFDNVGGEISDGVMMNINRFARIAICGVISQYNDTGIRQGPRLQSILLSGSALMKGFLVRDYSEKFPHAIGQLTHWLLEGKLHSKETLISGFEKLPEAFIGLFNGTNIGKMVVKI